MCSRRVAAVTAGCRQCTETQRLSKRLRTAQALRGELFFFPRTDKRTTWKCACMKARSPSSKCGDRGVYWADGALAKWVWLSSRSAVRPPVLSGERAHVL